MNNPTTPAPKILHADQEHNALRLLVPIFLFVGFCLSFFVALAILDALAPSVDSRAFLACVVAIPLGLIITFFVEKLLKRVWHSGQKVALQADGLTLYKNEGEMVSLDRTKSVNLTLWQFSLADYPRGGRERRVSASWFCIAARVQQDDEQVVLYCFAPPAEIEAWQATYSFYTINPTDVYNTSLLSRVTIPTRPEIPADVIAGKSGRYWLAERERWQYGVELTPSDFGEFLTHIHEYEIRF